MQVPLHYSVTLFDHLTKFSTKQVLPNIWKTIFLKFLSLVWIVISTLFPFQCFIIYLLYHISKSKRHKVKEFVRIHRLLQTTKYILLEYYWNGRLTTLFLDDWMLKLFLNILKFCSFSSLRSIITLYLKHR